MLLATGITGYTGKCSLKELIKYISLLLGFRVLLVRMLKLATLGKIDYIEKVQRMSEDRSFSCEEAVKDFGYTPLSFQEEINAEVKEYIHLQGRE